MRNVTLYNIQVTNDNQFYKCIMNRSYVNRRYLLSNFRIYKAVVASWQPTNAR